MIDAALSVYEDGEALYFGIPTASLVDAYLGADRRRVTNPLYVRPLSPSLRRTAAPVPRTLQRTALTG